MRRLDADWRRGPLSLGRQPHNFAPSETHLGSREPCLDQTTKGRPTHAF